jgi:hypothetical protein
MTDITKRCMPKEMLCGVTTDITKHTYPKEMLCGNDRYNEKIHAQRNAVWVTTDITKRYMPKGMLCG